MNAAQGARIHVTGLVQGVGFRPFVFGLAERLALKGWVRNTSAGVEIAVEGAPQALRAFLDSLKVEAPPLARIDQLVVEEIPVNGFTAFEICPSEAIPQAFQPISPDVDVCPDCLRELFDPADRRYGYPFINCTNCGPRFTIIADIPYDRPNTTMARFAMCPECAAEYHDPTNRRFHAQPVACPVCGPRIWLETVPPRAEGGAGSRAREVALSGVKDGATAGRSASQQVLRAAQELLSQGSILAVKGIGGFHLACDATNAQAVAALRRRKLRVDKPFALMMANIETVESHCAVSPAERALLESRARPIVILRRRPSTPIAAAVAPGQDTLGVMLPYSPLHYLLFSGAGPSSYGQGAEPSDASCPPAVLVMTSGNLSEEPIATDNDEARHRLAGLADAFLMHDRPIQTRCDDSVMRVFDDGEGKTFTMPLRRSRGYAPFPVLLPRSLPPILAVGAELKNAFCLARERYAFLSHHIGDMENVENLHSFEQGIAHYERLFRFRPRAIACDLHPDYLATRYAAERAGRESLPLLAVQHHHAHVAACMAEHRLAGDRPVIGIAFDGTGYGEDGAIWGGEFLLADYTGYRRMGHLAYVPMPGGTKAILEPWRMALAWLDYAGLPWREDLEPVRWGMDLERRLRDSGYAQPASLTFLKSQLRSHLNAPLTSSMGRLFDALSSLLGLRQTVNYEAQAAIELEACLDPVEEQAYPFEISPALIVDPSPLLHALLVDLRAGAPISILSARFHNGVAEMVSQVCLTMRRCTSASTVTLSGGVWQNLPLLQRCLSRLRHHGFTVYLHQQVPPNDGGLALGQATIAGYRLEGLAVARLSEPGALEATSLPHSSDPEPRED